MIEEGDRVQITHPGNTRNSWLSGWGTPPPGIKITDICNTYPRLKYCYGTVELIIDHNYIVKMEENPIGAEYIVVTKEDAMEFVSRSPVLEDEGEGSEWFSMDRSMLRRMGVTC